MIGDSLHGSACLVINPVTVDNFAALFNCYLLKLFILVGTEALSSVAWSTLVRYCHFGVSPVNYSDSDRGSTDDLLLQISSCVVWQTRDLHLSLNTYMYLLSPRLW